MNELSAVIARLEAAALPAEHADDMALLLRYAMQCRHHFATQAEVSKQLAVGPYRVPAGIDA